MVKVSCQTPRTGKGPTSGPYLPNLRPLTSQHILQVILQTRRRPTARSLRGPSLFPGSGLFSRTPPDPLTPLISFPSLKAPFAHAAAPGLLQGSESPYQLQTGDPSTLTAPEKRRNMEDAETDTGSAPHHDAPVLDAGSTGDERHSFQARTTPHPLTDRQQAANCLHPGSASGFTGLAEVGDLGKRGPFQQSWWGRGRRGG